MRHLLFFLLTFWPTTGLAVSPIPTEIYAEVDHGLRPAGVLADPVGYRGRTLLLGGIVERTVSDPWRHAPWCAPWYYGPYPRWRFGGSYYRHRH
ncbi:MAG: hypothetical protein ACYC9I_01920 [Desulfuromonadales bacterium]